MSTFGHKLRHERESRNTRIQEVSARTNIGLDYLEALENNDFDALPGPRGFGKLYIRAYAEMLGFDPRSLIEAFEEERRKRSKIDDDQPPPRKQPRIVLQTLELLPHADSDGQLETRPKARHWV